MELGVAARRGHRPTRNSPAGQTLGKVTVNNRSIWGRIGLIQQNSGLGRPADRDIKFSVPVEIGCAQTGDCPEPGHGQVGSTGECSVVVTLEYRNRSTAMANDQVWGRISDELTDQNRDRIGRSARKHQGCREPTCTISPQHDHLILLGIDSDDVGECVVKQVPNRGLDLCPARVDKDARGTEGEGVEVGEAASSVPISDEQSVGNLDDHVVERILVECSEGEPGRAGDAQ